MGNAPTVLVVQTLLTSSTIGKCASAAAEMITCWIRTWTRACPGAKRKKHMARLEKLVRRRAKTSKGQLDFFFLKKGASFALTL